MAAHIAPPAWRTEPADYGERFADYCEVEDRRVGLPPAMSAAARPARVERGTRLAEQMLESRYA